ncbi:MAG: hypothetical protein US68_C0009G0009 [Candidatus Shapirobacteria bacterium GW2011_GWE1_38_10]|uniref:Glycosyltransferase RgtA/B/C/D-like domain-containing protein n=1 Tax=Candidatus Shapirobacteria bacterium GW2011_GWE1_38_10 TaxID=1618488 RepID=A0A0G0KLJ1_9BACT|nr:MAG: hypothetical protein US46_C0002G0026 [Candidatus Shapirobacteria bacterium GW2011_GWF2_37_20]KKQ50054.1 MAG: hypothetical protein US68_C0009G0009 [Candidatus Shapirobacteria bacterium GW2011_GWE1_38_10]KKQ64554.1 MAG: hypothetical protein US85_C0007G0011 [Candidatus Shapirobacteria bacterium GW2011_GWF1_38_23]HBP51126.1 hypothetical protein [Candidatus Shapirobacteria bacterium]
MKNWLIFIVLGIIYFALAIKDPFITNNLISNLEPGPDTFYYSVPAWNLVHGNGFKMVAHGVEIRRIVPPLYGLTLVPFFKIFNDVRSYYFLNLLLDFISIYLFLILIKEFFGKEGYLLKFALGLVLVTNFYFYNLPTLLMAENLLIPLTLAAAILMIKKLDLKNFILSLLIIPILAFTKVSSFPVLVVFGIVLMIKIISSKFLYKIPKKMYWFLIPLLVLVVVVTLSKIVLPNIEALSGAGNNFSPVFLGKTLPIFLKEFVGIDGKYLWYNNQQIEKFVGILALFGMLFGLFLRKFRINIFILGSVILMVTVFHSLMSYPEGRYISTVVPLFLIFAGILFEKFKSPFLIIIFLGIYFLSRGTINGFYERKVTSLKRQILNNRLEENEVPWNYRAMENFNSYFREENNDTYLGSLINPFYVMYFGNGNYQYLPISVSQEFSGKGKGFIEKIYEDDKTIVSLYRRLLTEGKKVYVTNYYLKNYKGSKEPEYKNLEDSFKLTQVKDGCLGECKIYLVELRKK